jgi:5'-nucleotidase
MKRSKKIFYVLILSILFCLFVWLVSRNAFADKSSDSNTGKDSSVTTVTQGTSDLSQYLSNTDLTGYTIIMHTNDVHGRISPKASKGQMGYTAVSALKKLYEKAGAQVILLDAGDTLHGTDFAKKGSGKRIVSIMNLIGYDAMVPGNNDFNYGVDSLLKREKKMSFPLISANITYKKDGEDFLRNHFIIEKNGVKYGIFGLTTTDTVLKEDPKDFKHLKFNNPITAARKEVKELQSEGAQVIIALAHLGIDDKSEYTSKDVAKEVKGIGLIVDGHSHSAIKYGLKEGSTLIVSAGQYLENIGVVTIDPKGKMKAALVNSKEYKGRDSVIDSFISSYSDKKS